jgi:hypothetical protein
MVRTRISTIITSGPSLTGLRGTQLVNSISYTLVTDDTSTKHPAHQAQISPRTRHGSSRASSRSPWPKSRASEMKGMQASRGQSSRSRGQVALPSPDLSVEHHLSSGGRRGSSESSTVAARRRSRQGNRERGGDASE